MKQNSFSDYEKQIFSVVAAIPYGKVATYGQIAFLTGHPERSRMVGRALSRVPEELNLPCHRVVNHAGRTAPAWTSQRHLLEKEHVHFKQNGHVDLDRCLWNTFQP